MASRVPIALITGCSSGIGKHLALEFARRGVDVLATARNPASLEELTRKYPNIRALPLELANSDSIEKLVKQVEKLTEGRLDYLVNNAGTHYQAMLLDADIAETRKLFEVNVFAVMKLCHMFTPMLMSAGPRRGVILQIGSVTREVPLVYQGMYNASKAAMSQYTKTLRLELQPFGVEVVETVTGFVQSKITQHPFLAPETSLYGPLLPTIEAFKKQGNSKGMSAEDYAKSVVSKVMDKKRPYEIWEGTLAWKLWALMSFLPYRVQNLIFYKWFKLDLVKYPRS